MTHLIQICVYMQQSRNSLLTYMVNSSRADNRASRPKNAKVRTRIILMYMVPHRRCNNIAFLCEVEGPEKAIRGDECEPIKIFLRTWPISQTGSDVPLF
jgi:hypothetical protein